MSNWIRTDSRWKTTTASLSLFGGFYASVDAGVYAGLNAGVKIPFEASMFL